MTLPRIGVAGLLAGCLAAAPSLLSCWSDRLGSIGASSLEDVLPLTCPGYLPNRECPCRGPAEPDTYARNRACEEAIPMWLDASVSAGLEYSDECADRILPLGLNSPEAAELECSADPDASRAWLDCEDECQIYFGIGQLGDACETTGRRMSTCAMELSCGYDGRCHRPCERPLEIPEGGRCGYVAGMLQERCADGLQCDPQGVCVAEPSAGVTCEPGAPFCRPGEWCPEATMQCAPTVDVGVACGSHAECTTGVCAGTCQTADPVRCDQPWF